MRIAVFSAAYPLGAEGIVTRKFIETLGERGHAVIRYELDPAYKSPFLQLDSVLRECRSLRYLRRPRLDGCGGRYWAADRFVPGSVAAFISDHTTHPVDIIISRYMPLESAIAGYWASSISGVPWISCINDPLPYRSPVRTTRIRILLNWLREQMTRLWLPRVYTTPAMTVFPCDRLRDWTVDQVGNFGASVRRRSAVIPHVGPIGAFDVKATIVSSEPVIRHIGALGQPRDIRTLLTALHEWEQRQSRPIRIEFIGHVADVHRRALAGFMNGHTKATVRILPSVSYQESVELMRTSTACLLVELDASESVFLPSKFCDYAVAQRPIIAITPPRSTVRDYLVHHGGGIAVEHGDSGRCYEAISRVSGGTWAELGSLAEQFSVATVGEQWEEILARATACVASLGTGQWDHGA